MQVWTYPEKTMEEFGARAWQVEWWTIRSTAKADPNSDDDFDWDRDLISNYRRFRTREAARRFAKAAATKSHFGTAQIQEEVVDWFVEEDRVAEWTGVGDAEEVVA